MERFGGGWQSTDGESGTKAQDIPKKPYGDKGGLEERQILTELVGDSHSMVGRKSINSILFLLLIFGRGRRGRQTVKSS
jgi:hypothetical protein